jgi:hypothetical protein
MITEKAVGVFMRSNDCSMQRKGGCFMRSNDCSEKEKAVVHAQ